MGADADRVWHHADGSSFQPAVYILASRPYGTLDTGVTSELARRVFEHREGLVPGFTRRYAVKLLVCYEFLGLMVDAIHREKCIKEWRRTWKIELIESPNPAWRDLYEDLNL